MYAQVLLLNGFDMPLWYKVPPHLAGSVHEGCVVHVPLQKREESALIMVLAATLDKSITFTIREMSGLGAFPNDTHYHDFIEKVARYHCLQPLYFYQRIRHFFKEKQKEIELTSTQTDEQVPLVTLTDEQQPIVDYVTPLIKNPAYAPILIHGVTGSGKTEVYKRLIEQAVAHNKSALLLLPEVTLALQFEHLLRAQLPNVTIVGFHSASKVTEKKQLWERLVRQESVLLIGVHLPILLPIQNLGIIMVDEEHEHGFQEKKHPKMNSKEIALWRAHHYNIPIVLGSATPSLTSLYNVKRHGWKMFSITKRFAGAFPEVQKVILTEKGQRRRKVFWVSPQLEAAIKERLAKKEQIIIFLNRRGYSFFVQCKSCGFIFECKHCSVSLTLHVDTGQQLLRCHYCDFSQQLPPCCPGCKAPERELLKRGIGTQQMVQIFKELFPAAVIERADMDSTSKKRSWQNTVADFKAGKIDMLVGTQTITKGYHFPKVTLVGVLWADLNLHFPFYNASEMTLQQLIQVAGRAGRQCAGGKVIVQAMHDHPVFNYLDEQKYLDFCTSELEAREDCFYPPFARLACIELKHESGKQIDADAKMLAEQLQLLCDRQALDVSILGPAYPLIHRIQNAEVRHIMLKAASFKHLHVLLDFAQRQRMLSSVFVVASQ